MLVIASRLLMPCSDVLGLCGTHLSYSWFGDVQGFCAGGIERGVLRCTATCLLSFSCNQQVWKERCSFQLTRCKFMY